MSYDDVSNEQILEEMNAQTPNSDTPEKTEEVKPEKSEPQLYEYQAAGRTVKEPLDLVLKRASMGYDYSQKMEALKQHEAKMAELQAENEKLSRYREYDNYAKENPKWNEHLQQTWQQRETLNNPDLDPEDPVIKRIAGLEQALNEKLGGFESKVSTFDKYLQDQQMRQESSALDGEIKSVREQFKDVDFDAADPSGNSLERRVLQHMSDNNIANFGTAFKDLHFDHLIKSREEKVKEDMAADLQKRNKTGLLGESNTPIVGGKLNQPVSSMSYDQLGELALREIEG